VAERCGQAAGAREHQEGALEAVAPAVQLEPQAVRRACGSGRKLGGPGACLERARFRSPPPNGCARTGAGALASSSAEARPSAARREEAHRLVRQGAPCVLARPASGWMARRGARATASANRRRRDEREDVLGALARRGRGVTGVAAAGPAAGGAAARRGGAGRGRARSAAPRAARSRRGGGRSPGSGRRSPGRRGGTGP
jgi:hypothetical protein